MGLADGQLETRTVVLHDGREVELPVEFVDYYLGLKLLLPVPDRPDVVIVDHWLKAKVDEKNGGLRFWNKEPAEIVPYCLASNYQVTVKALAGWVEGDGGFGITAGRYTAIQTAWRAYRQSQNGNGELTASRKKTRAERTWERIRKEVDEFMAKEAG